MESRQFYISVSEGVYNSWRAVGVLEGLHSDGDIGHFLVTLYSSQKQEDGGGSSIRCVHCHCHLSLYCTTCHCPSHLALPLHPHHPPPSLTSPPSPHPLPVSLSSPHTLDTSVPPSGDTDAVNTPVLNSEKPDASLEVEKTEADLSEDEGEFDFDDCPVDFGTVKPVSPFSVVEDDPCESETPGTDDLETHTAVGRRHGRSSLTKPVVSSRKERRKKRVASTVKAKSRQRKVMKKSQCLTKNSVTDCCRGGSKKTRQNNLLQTKDSVHTASSEEGDLQEKVGDVKSDVPEENLYQEEEKGTVFESAHLGDGVIIPTEERLSAEIHMFDNSFFKHHRVESKPLNCMKQMASSSANNPLTGFTAEDMRQNQELLEAKIGEDGVSHLKMESSSEALSVNDTGRPSLRILVSGQKIPPIKTADGSYIRSLYSYFECLFCRKAFIHKRSFNKHIQTHVEENLFKCTVCKKGFESLYNLTEHEKKHKFECEVCGKKCTEKTDYNNHMKLHTENDGVMKCPGCSYQSTDFYVYRKHKYECAYLRPALQCEICGVHLKSVKSLKHHIAAIHKNDRPYKCSLCDKSFVFKTKLNCHMKYNHAEGGRLFHCDKCGNRFIDPKGLKSHQKSVHSNEKPFKCSYCPSAFARKYTLGVHMRLHTGEKPFRCTECLQAFVQKPSLLLHLKSHHGQQSKVSKMQAETENGP